MKWHLTILGISFYSVSAMAATYCPQGQAFIHVGMSEAEVIAACGQPNARMQPKNAITQKTPVTQLIYTSVTPSQPYPGINAALLSQWSLPTNMNDTMSVQIDIVNQKVVSVSRNGNGVNALSICGGRSVQVGDDESQVYSACGTPDTTNFTYENRPIPGDPKAAIWVYQVDQYQPPIRLTFVNGSLESID